MLFNSAAVKIQKNWWRHLFYILLPIRVGTKKVIEKTAKQLDKE